MVSLLQWLISIWVIGNEETESQQQQQQQQHQHQHQQQQQQQQHVLAVLTCQGQLSLMKSFDDLNPYTIQTELVNPIIEWNNEGEFICVAGHLAHQLAATRSSTSGSLFANYLHFFNNKGILRYRIPIPYTQVLFHPLLLLLLLLRRSSSSILVVS